MSNEGAGEYCQEKLINETLMWNYLNPLRKWGHHLKKWGICLLL